MSKKILDQDTSKKAPEQEMLIANLLFREKPAKAEPDAIKAALEELVGTVEIVSGKKEINMFAVPKYMAIFKDTPQGMPVLSNIGAPREFSPDIVDELNRSQFWDYPNGSEAIDGFK